MRESFKDSSHKDSTHKPYHMTTPITTPVKQRSLSGYITPFMPSTACGISPSPIKISPVRRSAAPNYFKVIQTEHSPVRVLFKSGYEFQEENKTMKQENQQLKHQVKVLHEQLEAYLSFEEVFAENRKLKELVVHLQDQNLELQQELNRRS